MVLVPVSGPATEPITRAEAKLHLRIDHADEDGLIDSLVSTARRHTELTVLHRVLLTQTWDYYLSEFPGDGIISIPLPPLQGVSSVKYKDKDGAETTLATSEYIVDTQSEPGRVSLAYGKSWPSFTPYPINPIKITFTAGWTAAENVPLEIKQALLLLIGHFYENREIFLVGDIPRAYPLAYESLLASYRVWSF